MSDGGWSKGVWLVLGISGFIALLVVGLIVGPVIGSFVLGTGEKPAPNEFPPEGSFSSEGGKTVTFVRDSGESVDATRLGVSVNGERIGSWATLKDEDGTVTEGERLEITSVSAGDEVILVWLGSDEPTVVLRETVTGA